MDIGKPGITAAIAIAAVIAWVYIGPLILGYWWLFLLGIGGAIAAKMYFNGK